MNSAFLTGNIGRDAEVKTLTTTTLLSFSMAFQSGFGDNKKSCWIKCNIFGKRAENANLLNELKKGVKVAVSGELGQDEWEKDGHKHSMLTLNVTGWPEIFGTRDTSSKGAVPQQQAAPQQSASQQSSMDDFSDDIPF